MSVVPRSAASTGPRTVSTIVRLPLTAPWSPHPRSGPDDTPRGRARRHGSAVAAGQAEEAPQASGEGGLGQRRIGAGAEVGEAEVGVGQAQAPDVGEGVRDVDPGARQRLEGLRHGRARSRGGDGRAGPVRRPGRRVAGRLVQAGGGRGGPPAAGGEQERDLVRVGHDDAGGPLVALCPGADAEAQAELGERGGAGRGRGGGGGAPGAGQSTTAVAAAPRRSTWPRASRAPRQVATAPGSDPPVSQPGGCGSVRPRASTSPSRAARRLEPSGGPSGSGPSTRQDPRSASPWTTPSPAPIRVSKDTSRTAVSGESSSAVSRSAGPGVRAQRTMAAASAAASRSRAGGATRARAATTAWVLSERG